MRITDLIGLGEDALKFSAVILILALAVWGIAYQYVYKTVMHGKKELSVRRAFPYGLLMIVILVIIYATLMVRGEYYEGNASLVPFASYKLAWYQFNAREWRNLILNICMFIPFGFMLPAASSGFRKAWKTYLAGFAFTLLIESLQFLLQRGIFETDDLINNVLGTMIGYGFFSVASALASACKNAWANRNPAYRKSQNGKRLTRTSRNQNSAGMRRTSLSRGMEERSSNDKPAGRKPSKQRSLQAVVLLQVPLLLVIASFALIFISYHRKELGNMAYENISRHRMPEVSIGSDIPLSTEETVGNIYQVKTAAPEETRRFAEEMFALQGQTVDDSETMLYDETAVYYSREGGLCLWIDYMGCTVWYINHELDFSKDGTKGEPLSKADEQTVREAVGRIGFTIPEHASFTAGDNGNYIFKADEALAGDIFSAGTVNCKLNGQGEVTDMNYDIVTGGLYKQVPLISSREAYDLVCRGRFSYWASVPDDRPFTVTGMKMVYFADTKGFWQPLYEFILDNGGGEMLGLITREQVRL